MKTTSTTVKNNFFSAGNTPAGIWPPRGFAAEEGLLFL